MDPAPNAPEALADVLQAVLKTYEVLFLLARHFHPPRFSQFLEQVGRPEDELRAMLSQHAEALASIKGVNEILQAASNEALGAFVILRQVQAGAGDLRDAFRAFRHVPLGLEALYALAGVLPPLNRFFLNPKLRTDPELQALYTKAPVHEQVGVMHFATGEDDEGERGGFWLYVPEHYAPDRAWPLVMALHGGSGTGHQFLWSWLRDARSLGAVLVAPSSLGATWALSGEDVDTPNLRRMLAFIRDSWNIDPSRIMLTGMSDGGTFTYLTGMDEESPFTHIAPVAAAFNPLLIALSGGGRTRGMPVHVVHGALDWMFPVSMAREATEALRQAGANVTYREIEDLSHTYPREINAELLQWLGSTPSI